MGLHFSIALFAGMVAATLVPYIHRAIPRWLEIASWVGLIFVCWLAIASIREPHTRELTDSLNWAAARIVNTLLGLAGAGFVDMLLAHRFAIANAVVTVFGVDLMALAVVSSYRESRGWQPQVRLRDWMEIPLPPLALDETEQPVSPGARSLAQVVNIQELRNAQSPGRSGAADSTEKRDENGREHPDQLAS